MPLPAKRKLRIIQGATFRASWTWVSGGVPVDFTGCTARMQVRSDVDSPDVLLELTTENGGIALGAEPGRIELMLGATHTASGALDWDSGVYDLEIQFASGPNDVVRFAGGAITVSPEVTRA